MSAHTSSRFSPLIKPILIGLCVGVVTATLFLSLCALLVYKLSLPTGAVTPLAVVALGLGGLGGGVAAGLCAKKNGLLTGAVCATLLYLVLLVAGLSRGGVSPAFAVLKWAVLTVCSAAGSIWGVNRR